MTALISGKLQDGGMIEERGIAPELIDPGFAPELLIPGI